MVEKIWNWIIENEGENFKQIKGKEFTYQIVGNGLKLSTTNQMISKSVIEKAIGAPSYLYAILTDKRIIEWCVKEF